MDKMSALMQGLRDKPLTEIAGHAIVKVTDYQKPEETGLPAANVLIYKLDNGETVVVRPSEQNQRSRSITQLSERTWKRQKLRKRSLQKH